MELKPGDTLLYRSKGFLPKTIQYFMKRYAKKKYGKKNPEYPICNHMGTVIEYKDELYVAEAIGKGFVIKPVHIYDRLGTSVFAYRPKEPFTPKETNKIKDYAIYLSFNQTGYEYLNFLWWIVYITTNFRLFLGGRKDKYVFCFESAFRCLNASGKFNFKMPYLQTSVDLQEDDRFFMVKN